MPVIEQCVRVSGFTKSVRLKVNGKNLASHLFKPKKKTDTLNCNAYLSTFLASPILNTLRDSHLRIVIEKYWIELLCVITATRNNDKITNDH